MSQQKIYGFLLILRALTPLIMIVLIMVNGLIFFNSIEADLSESLSPFKDSIEEVSANIQNINENIKQIQNTFGQVSINTDKAFKDGSAIIDKIKSVRLLKGILKDVPNPFNEVLKLFEPLQQPLKEVQTNIDSFKSSIEKIPTPIKSSMLLIEKRIRNWIIQISLLCVLSLVMLANYFVLPFYQDFMKGWSLLTKEPKK
ncbi:MAG: hypothetical protein ACRCU2_33630 [Planktothrix sp.]